VGIGWLSHTQSGVHNLSRAQLLALKALGSMRILQHLEGQQKVPPDWGTLPEWRSSGTVAHYLAGNANMIHAIGYDTLVGCTGRPLACQGYGAQAR
jgi:hypothetical protein